MRKFVIFLLVSLLACSSAFAFGTTSNVLAGLFGGADVTVAEVSAPSPTESVSSSKSEMTSNPVSTALSEIEGNKTLNKTQTADLKAKLEDAQAVVEDLLQDALRIHPQILIGATFGLENNLFVFGPEIGLGLKFSNGMIIDASAGINLAWFDGINVGLKEGIGYKSVVGKIMIGYQF